MPEPKPPPSAGWTVLSLVQTALVSVACVWTVILWSVASTPGAIDDPGAVFLLALFPVAFLLGAGALGLTRQSLGGILREFLGTPWGLTFLQNRAPPCFYIDHFQAAERLAAACRWSRRLDCHGHGNLDGLIHSSSMQRFQPSRQGKLCVGPGRFLYLPYSALFLLLEPPGTPPGTRVVVWVRGGGHNEGGGQLEAASLSQEAAALVLDRLDQDARAHSIFRGQFIEAHYQPRRLPDFALELDGDELLITFKPRPQVPAADIILDDGLTAVLERNLFAFHAHRQELTRVGLPRRRTLLLYGPPGTGKTHTCRHILTRLPEATAILVVGQALLHLDQVGPLARRLAPAVVILEDVDLVFQQRERNPLGTALGDLMDQLDGFGPEDDVIFLLTTNALERVEAAIRDRPGRVNQCLHLGLPTPPLRRRYLARYLAPYAAAAVDLDHLVRRTDHTSQAFLREFVLRAVQIAAAEAGYPDGPAGLPLKTAHFDLAFDELTGHGDPSGHAIMGFHGSRT